MVPFFDAIPLLEAVAVSLITILALPTIGLAAPAAPPRWSQADDQNGEQPTSTRAVRGVVKSVTPALLVITRSNKNHSELALVLTKSTLLAGTIVVGAEVSVRYRIEGHTLTATAVVVNHPRPTLRTLPESIKSTAAAALAAENRGDEARIVAAEMVASSDF